MSAAIDILIPTFSRPTALAVTLTSLIAQTCKDFRVVISDQTEGLDFGAVAEIQTIFKVLRVHGHEVEIHRHFPRQGMAEQRQFLLDRAKGKYVLFLDDDLILEPYVIAGLYEMIRQESCGLVGSAVIGLSYINDVRPHEQAIEFWEGHVQPEEIFPGSPQWKRAQLHNAANIFHVQTRLEIQPDRPRAYRIAWVGGCAMYDAEKLRSAGGFEFWPNLPSEHSGEDVLAQIRVMRRYGGCGMIPSGVYHQELPTTIRDRRVDAPFVLDVFQDENHPFEE